MDSSNVHVAILSSPGMGHLIAVLALANRLATHHNIKVTVLAITTRSKSSESEFIEASTIKSGVDVVIIPSVDVSHLIDANAKVFTQLCVLVREALPSVRSAIAGMSHVPNALILDIFCTQFMSIAEEFNIPKYVYHASTAWSASLSMYCQVFDKQIEGQYVDLKECLEIPGCKPVQPEYVVGPMLDRNDKQYVEYVKLGMEYASSDGILTNTWEDIEPETFKALRENVKLRSILKKPEFKIYPIGPLTRSVEVTESDDEVIQWLDKQNPRSVLYVSFGSGAALSFEQTTELALGLELSQHKFVWVARPPTHGDANSSYLNSAGTGSTDDAINYLPHGFLTRTKDVGLVVPKWAKQLEILSHVSVGGFLSHCGWNSTVESLTNGIPMIAWPLHAEQKMNAALLTEELGVAIGPAVLPTKKVVEREEVEAMIRRLMLYKEVNPIRERANKVKISAENALSKGGSSYNSTCELVKDIQMKLS